MAKIQRQDLELQNTTQLGTSNRAVWGGGMRYDYVDQPLLFTTPVTLHQSRIFAHDEWRVTESALVNVGAMYENDGAGHKNTSPRISLNYHLLPQHTLRASISSATRNPMMAEMYMKTAHGAYWTNAYAPPAKDLRPEKILSKEIGYVGQFGALSVDGRIYYDKVRDIIMVDAYVTGDPFNRTDSFKNMFDATFKGLDISAKYHWEDGKVTVNYSRQQTSCAFSSYPTQYFNPTPVAANRRLAISCASLPNRLFEPVQPIGTVEQRQHVVEPAANRNSPVQHGLLFEKQGQSHRCIVRLSAGIADAQGGYAYRKHIRSKKKNQEEGRWLWYCKTHSRITIRDTAMYRSV